MDDLDLVLQVRIGVDLIDVHRPAEHNESAIAAHIDLRERVAREVHVANSKTRTTQEWVEHSQWFAGRMLQD